jgi:glucosamine kinase
LCGHKPGIAIILGTGSNSCYYDGENIVANNPSLGFILGDEGSGGYLGKKILQAFLYNEMPADLHESFKTRYPITKEEVLDNVYKKSMPNRYTATFSRFLQHHVRHPFAAQMIYDAFADFFDHHVLKYPEYKQVSVNGTGSVAFYFSDILRAVAADKGCSIGTILESPIAGLTLYHTEEN